MNTLHAALVASAAALAGASFAVAQTTEPHPQAQATASSATTSTNTAPQQNTRSDPNERVCRAVEGTGSRLSRRRVCATRAEWEAQARAAQELTSNTHRNATLGCAGGQC